MEMVLHLCAKKRNASSYSTSLVVDGPRLIIGSATIEMTNANVFLRDKGERRERSCKVEQRKWENIAKVSAAMREGNYRMDVNGTKRGERKGDRAAGARSTIII